jgi:hypothetical protein
VDKVYVGVWREGGGKVRVVLGRTERAVWEGFAECVERDHGQPLLSLLQDCGVDIPEGADRVAQARAWEVLMHPAVTAVVEEAEVREELAGDA